MKECKKRLISKLTVFAILCITMMALALTVWAAATNDYDTDKEEMVTFYGNYTSTPKTVSVNTRPTSGTNGVRVMFKLPDGTITASRIFPFYTTIDDLTERIAVNDYRGIYVEPVMKGQTVRGVLALNAY